jgi:type II secretory pathway pseudopilin PulG
MTVTVIVGILSTIAVPRFGRSLEQAKADVAAANLRAIWTAERIYWLDHRAYTNDLSTFVDRSDTPQYNGLLDRSITSTTGNSPYIYQITQADASTFTATATRQGGGGWTGTLSILQDGSFTSDSVISCPGQVDIVIVTQ